MAEALVTRGLDVSLVERASAVMNTLDTDMGDLVSRALRDVGVTLYLEESVEGFETNGGRVTGVRTDRRTLPADIVILGIGTRPNTALARDAAIPLGQTGAIKVNARMQTEVEGVWAAGDCAEAFHLISRRPIHIALGTIANKQGRICGINLGGGYATFPGVVGTAVSKICAVEVARTGLNEKEARALGLEYVVGKIESTTRAGYFPGAGKITVKVLAERASGRLLGSQLVGIEGAAKRIDVFATALHAGMTVEEVQYLDLSYAPPFAPVWDPILIAARKAAEQL
jgi:NADPH-dependent 2,4-dienoyl-CoA reductase/sulfur reductase-like enzyme